MKLSSSIRSSGQQKKKESPIFRLLQVDIKLKEIRDLEGSKSPTRLIRLVRANGVIVFALADAVYRVVVSGGENRYDRLSLPISSDDSVGHIVLDQTGCHCIISLQKGGSSVSPYLCFSKLF
jgi:hypothetical protein